MSAEAPLRVLWVAPNLPWPLDSGGRIRVLQLLRAVRASAEVELWCVRAPGESENDLAAVRPHCARLRAFPRSNASTWRQLTRPKLARWFHSRELRAALASEARSSRFELVHLEELLLVDALPSVLDVPLVVHHQKLDLEFARALCAATGPDPRQRYDLAKLEWLERRAVRRTRRHVFCSSEDRALFESRHGALQAAAIPSGYDPDFFQGSVDCARDGRVLFLGSLDYAPNLDALSWWLREIWPRVLERAPQARLRVAGRAPSQALRRELGALPSVELLADLADVRPVLGSASLLAVPLRIGGGSRLKIVEALAMGTPVLSTRIGAEGLELRPGTEIALAESAEELAQGCADLLGDAPRARDLARAGQARVRSLYPWSRLGESLVEYWRACARAN